MDDSSPTPGPPSEPAPKRRWRRRLLWAAAALLIALMLAAAILATGYPQARLVEYAIHRATGFPARAERVGLYPVFRIERLTVLQGDVPALTIEGMAADYSLRPGATRRIPSVTAERIALRVDSELVSRITALTASSEPSAEPSLTFVPQHLSFEELEGQIVLPSVISDVAGIALECTVDSFQRLSFEVRGDTLSGHVELPLSGFATSLDGGYMHIAGAREGFAASLSTCQLLLPNLAEIEASASARLEGTSIHVTIDAPDFRIPGEGEKTVLVPGTDIPVTVGSLTVSDAHFEGMYLLVPGRFVPSAATLTGKATSVRIGVDDASWNLDTVDLAAQGDFPAYQLDLTVNDALPLQVSSTFEAEGIAASLTLPNWSREGLLTLLPVHYQAYLDVLPTLQHITAHADATLQFPGYDTTITLTPEFSGESPFAEPIRAQAKGSLGDSPTLSGDLIVRMDQGSVTAAVSAGPVAPFRVEAALDTVDPARLAAITPWAPLPEALARSVSGTLTAARSGDSLVLDANLVGAAAPWGTELVYPLGVTLEAKLRWDPATGTILGESLALRSEDALTITSDGWRVQSDPFTFEGTLRGKADLPRVSPAAADLALGAEIRFQAPVSLRDSMLTLSLDAQSDYFQFGDFSFYEAPFHATGNARLALDKASGTLRDFVLTYGDSSSLNVKEATLSLSPFQIEAPYELTSKLHLLVDAGLLESVEGVLRGSGRLDWRENLVLTSGYTLEAPLLVTGGSSVALGGIAADGDLAVDQTISSTAALNAAKCVLAGVPLTNVTAPLSLEDTLIRLDPVAGEVFGGTIRGTAAVDTSGESPVIQADMQFRNVDLELFTEKMVSADYAMKGLAQGRITARLTPDGLEDATVRMVSSGDFAMNKALLQEVLLPYLRDMPGGQAIERISAEVLGKDEWRAFDSAALELRWAGNKMVGTATFRSANLNLTVDLNIDEGSIRQMLELQQRARLEDIENIRAEPVQQKDEPN